MNETLMFAKYNQAGNKAIIAILNGMSNDEREMDRGSYFGSLSALFRHVPGGTYFFLGMFKTALEGNAAAVKAISDLPALPPQGPLTEAQWKEFVGTVEAIDAAYVAMAEALSKSDLELSIKVDWFGGNPPQVPLSFMLSNLVVHNTHHRGQVSQILDSLKIDNDWSGIDVAFI